MNGFFKDLDLAIGIVLSWIFSLACSWAVSCFVIWLIALCFGIDFQLRYATGIWLIVFVALILIKIVSNIVKTKTDNK